MGAEAINTYRQHIDKGGFARILNADKCELHFFLEEETAEPVQKSFDDACHESLKIHAKRCNQKDEADKEKKQRNQSSSETGMDRSGLSLLWL